MPTYTLKELLEMMEPQARRDKELITQCVSGLGLYAAQRAQDFPGSSKIEELRDLAENLVGYWGLDFGDGAKPLDDFMQSFDSLVDEAKSGGEILAASPNPNFAADTVYGLYRYGEDMVVGQGDMAKADILSASLLMREIGKAWDFSSYMLDDLASRLEDRAVRMYQTTPLPGQPGSGKNAGYEIKQKILFDNDRGFALAHNPAAASPFVTWIFSETNGERSYDWGHYLGSEAKARADYIYRVEDYTETYKVTEKTAETAQEPAVIDIKATAEPQPLVTVTLSEHEQLRGIEKMPLHLANPLFFDINKKAQESSYFKTYFQIDFIMRGKPESYTGRYDVGISDGSLTDHIRNHAEYQRLNEDYQQYLSGLGEGVQMVTNANLDFIARTLVPMFEKHCEVSEMKAAALNEITAIYDKASGNPPESALPRIDYLESVMSYSDLCREALNSTGLSNLPEAPAPYAEAKSEPHSHDSLEIANKREIYANTREMDEHEFKESMAALIPGVDPQAIDNLIVYAGESDKSDFFTKGEILRDTFLEFVLVKRRDYDDDVIRELLDICKTFALDPSEILGAAKHLKEGVPPKEIAKMAVESECDETPEEHNEFLEALKAYGNGTLEFSPEKTAETLGDPSVTKTDMYIYGYTWDGMIPLGKERALELYDKGHEVFRLYEDDAEGVADLRAGIASFDGLFGIEDPSWIRPERGQSFQMFIFNNEKYNKGESVGEWLTLPADADDLRGLLERIGVDKSGEFAVSAVRMPMEELLQFHVTHCDSLDEINMLASYMSDMDGYELDKLRTILSAGIFDIGEGTSAVINLLDADNFDAFVMIDAADYEVLGRYYAQTQDKPDDVSFEEFGRQNAKGDKGVFSGVFMERNYIYHRYDKVTREYDGVVPDEYKIVEAALQGLRSKAAARENPSVIDEIKAARQAQAQSEPLIDKDVPKAKKDKGEHDI